MDIKAAFFDLDGTLLDSMGMWAEIDRRSLGRRGIAVPEDFQKAVSVMRIHEAARYTVERFGLPEDPQDLEREWMDMARREYAHNVPLKPGAWEYLNALRAQGVRLGVLTSTAPGLFEPALKRCGVYELFDVVMSAAEVPRGKAFPDAYIMAAQRMGVEPRECAMYDDMAPALRAARAAGMYAVGVYDAHAGTARAELEAAADEFIESFDGRRRAAGRQT